MSELANEILDGLIIPAEVVQASEAVPVPEAPAVPATPEQPVPVAPIAAQPEPAPRQDHSVPLPTFLDIRDQLKEAKNRLRQLEAQPAPQVPSASHDPEAFARYQADLVNSTRTSTVFDMSEVMATEKHGAEPVKAAMDWAMEQAQASPAFAAEYLKQKHPIDWAVKQQKRNALLAEIGDDPEAYKAKIRAELSATPVAQSPVAQLAPSPQPTAPIPAQATPTRSLASAPTAGAATSVPAHPVAAIDAVFR